MAHADPTSIPGGGAISPSPRFVEAYRIGESSFGPGAAIILLSEEIHAADQKTFDVTWLYSRVDETRKAELASATTARNVLTTCHAPAVFVAQYQQACTTLAAPLVIAPSVVAADPARPDLQNAESVFAEADALFPDDHGALRAWIKLSHGSQGLWAFHLGELDSAIVTDTVDPNNVPLLDTTQHLADTAPSQTPQSIVDDLRNVAALYNSKRVDKKSLNDLDTAIRNLFGD